MRQKVIIIGLDGATFEVLQPWIENGRLPNLRALLSEGVSGELESCVPPVTAPAWASFMTGKNPGKHGIFDFVVQDERTYQFRPVNSQLRHGKTLWEVIGDQGGRVVVLNVPLTHPPDPVNGALISDYLLATGRGIVSHPPELLTEIEERFGRYPTDTAIPYFMATQSDEDIERFIREYTEALRYKFEVARYLWDQIDPDFLMLHLYGNDQICHWLWHVLDETHPEHVQSEAEEHTAMILRYYRAFDEEIGRWLDRLDGTTTLFIVSDHGFGPVYKAIDLNTWLYREGYLALKNRPLTRLRRLAWEAGLVPDRFMGRNWIKKGLARLARYVLRERSQGGVDQLKWAHRVYQILLSFNDIDWSRTKAYSPFGFGQIRINVRGKWAQGCVAPGEEYDAIKREIVRKLRALRDPDTGESIDAEVLVREEVYQGEFLDQAPDIFFIPVKGKYRPKSMGFTSNKIVSDFWGMTGIHKMNGILIAQGSPLKQGARIEEARITDIFASVLYLMGLKIPPDVDGRVLDAMFTEFSLETAPIRFDEASVRQLIGAMPIVSSDEESQVIDRLRNLGYLD